MRVATHSSVVLLSVFLTACAGEGTTVYEPSGPSAEGALPVALRVESLRSETPSLRFTLPDGRSITAQRERASRSELGLTWAGTFEGGTALIVVHEDRSATGVFEVENHTFLLQSTGPRVGTVREQQRLAQKNCAEPQLEPRQQHSKKQDDEEPIAPTVVTPEALAGAPLIIDVAAFYTEEFLGNEQPVRNFIDTSIAMANQVFVNSGVNTQYRLVYKGPLTGAQPPPGTVSTFNDGNQYEQREVDALNWLNTLPAEVNELRDAAGADMVALFIPSPVLPIRPYVCGVANRPSSQNLLHDGSAFNGRAFTVQRNDCGLGDFTFAHELGHNFGMFHNANDLAVTPFPRHPFAAGATYVSTSTKAGMAASTMNSDLCVGTASPASVCRRSPFFSGPNVFANGIPTGDATHDNARVANIETPGFAGFRAPGASTVPTVLITSPARNATINNVFTLTGTATDVESGNLSANIRWFDGTIYLGQGASLTATLQSGARTITARATDFSGVVGQWSVRVTVQHPPPVAAFTWSCSGLTCTFSPNTSTGHQLAVFWTFPAGASSSGGPTPTVTFPGGGTYSVTLTVTDYLGRSSTSTRPVSVAGANLTPRTGNWYNPQRSGHGIDLIRVPSGAYLVFWFTYLNDGTPVWYISDSAFLNNGQWSAPLFFSQWNTSTNTNSITTVGTLSMSFSDTTNATFNYTVDGVSGSEAFTFLAGGDDRSGAWYEPALSGYGIQIEEQTGYYGASVAFYEGSQPRWVLGSTAPGPSVSMNLSWLRGLGLCPGCTYIGGPTSQPAGSLSLQIDSGATSGWATMNITTPSGATWNRPWVNMVKLSQ